MTRKDYVLIAEAIRTTRYISFYSEAEEYQMALDNLAGHLSRILEMTNERFDTPKFLSACQIGKRPRAEELV